MAGDCFQEEENILKVIRNKNHVSDRPADRGEKAGTGPYVYQYRTLDSFWAIIESDSFWATNARFSNDQEEQKLGIRKIKEILDKDEQMFGALGDCYIICFCEEDDKLSQWRGYAPEGVSIGFDFNNIRPFYIKKKNEDAYVCIFNSCYNVRYIQEDTPIEEFAREFTINTSNDRNSHENVVRASENIVPYVKHKGFYEEAESRLVFTELDSDELSDCIHYRKIGNIKVPYIIVKAGDTEKEKKSDCTIKLIAKAEEAATLKERLRETLYKKRLSSVQVVSCTETNEGEFNDQICFGCTLREKYNPTVNANKPKCRYHCEGLESFHIDIRNEIYISDSQKQELVYKEVYACLKNMGKEKEIKIWCEGHLPIRSITVGNLRNKEIVEESIRHYCNQHYWLQSVDVKSSVTPYRSSLL